ncbi:CPBP family intramembrane glutamic endopeptidase [Gulosibacter sp. 10]|uniref:CPBP family intramembrane glutamic endopeptidase n=1 Tax=Gulosibacter sp. 10 TaxID=1255570 RepID=UPI00097ED5C3|nr:CPBP family intramembrane glutamic endopeptidase [Gulosibacter sp. 10]SJM71779.1 hypothetical protein FM112_16855 [Gulosibacter sp. 10]
MSPTTDRQLQKRAGALLLARVGLVALVTVLMWLFAVILAPGSTFPPSMALVTLGLVPVNVLSLLLVARFLHAEGERLRDLFIPASKGRLLRDIGWGILWILVLYLPFAGAIAGAVWLLHGSLDAAAFESIFVDPEAVIAIPPGWSLVIGVLAVLTFAPINAPAEEALYRGYVQSRLVRTRGRAAAVLLSAAAFGLQHAFFAPTAAAIPVFVIAFFVWGLGSSLIVLRQGRLLPVVVAHFAVNLFTSAPAVVIPALQLGGVLPES